MFYSNRSYTLGFWPLMSNIRAKYGLGVGVTVVAARLVDL